MLGYGKKKYLFAESLCKSIRKTKKGNKTCASWSKYYVFRIDCI